MKIVFFAVFCLALLGCEQSVDVRFEAVCAEMKHSDMAEASAQACLYKDNIPKEGKLVMIRNWEKFKASEKRLNEVEAEGRSKGYLK